MPYTPTSDNLPANVKKLPPKKKRQWIHVFNSAISSGHSESSAFAMANGVAGKKDMSMISHASNAISYLLGRPSGADASITFDFYKDLDGNERMRWFATVTNNYIDRESDIFTSKAHQEYVDWAEKTKTYPELWLWHTKGTKWGTTDWLDYDADNGFVVASGTVDPGFEHVAKALREYPGQMGTSHAFHGLKQNDKYIVQYRMLEISPLPLVAAANVGTHFGVEVQEVAAMAFSDKRKDFLKSVLGVPDEKIAELEAQNKALGDQMKAMGFEFKDLQAGSTADVDEPVIEDAGTKALAASITTLTDATKAMADILKAQGEKHTADIAALNAKVDTISVDLAKNVENAFVAQVAKLPKGFDPTATKDNEPKGTEGQKSRDQDLYGILDHILGNEPAVA